MSFGAKRQTRDRAGTVLGRRRLRPCKAPGFAGGRHSPFPCLFARRLLNLSAWVRIVCPARSPGRRRSFASARPRGENFWAVRERACESSRKAIERLGPCLDYRIQARPHSSLSCNPPISRLENRKQRPRHQPSPSSKGLPAAFSQTVTADMGRRLTWSWKTSGRA